MNILQQIVADKRREVAEAKKVRPLDKLRAGSLARPAPPAFARSLASVPMGLIAEVKHRSPSAGVIRDPFDPSGIAAAYQAAGAQAVSVLMDGKYFGGGEGDFRQVRSTVTLPLLYKEFVVDEWQVWHAASVGASAVLLIAAVLDDAALKRFAACCAEARVEPLLEVHDAAEMERAVESGVRCIGINNRDLRTFVTTIDISLRLAPLAPPGTLLVGESGIRTAADVRRLAAGGIGAVLVGETLLRQPDLEAAVRGLMGPSGGVS